MTAAATGGAGTWCVRLSSRSGSSPAVRGRGPRGAFIAIAAAAGGAGDAKEISGGVLLGGVKREVKRRMAPEEKALREEWNSMITIGSAKPVVAEHIFIIFRACP